MTGSIEPVRERITRARQHFENLKALCDRFVIDDPNGPPGGLSFEQDNDAGRFTMRVLIPTDFPTELGYLAAETLFHVRAALDNLAWQLVLANGGTPGSHTEFPIFRDKDEFKKRAPRKMRGMSPTARAAIQRFQPFIEWPEHPGHTTLWKLHELNLIDKHRLPHITCLWLARVKGSAHIGDVDGRVTFARKRGCLEDKATLIELRWNPIKIRRRTDTNVQVQFQLSLDVAITNPGQIDFLTDRGEPAESVPLRHLFDIALDYLETTLLPAFAGEFG